MEVALACVPCLSPVMLIHTVPQGLAPTLQ